MLRQEPQVPESKNKSEVQEPIYQVTSKKKLTFQSVSHGCFLPETDVFICADGYNVLAYEYKNGKSIFIRPNIHGPHKTVLAINSTCFFAYHYSGTEVFDMRQKDPWDYVVGKPFDAASAYKMNLQIAAYNEVFIAYAQYDVTQGNTIKVRRLTELDKDFCQIQKDAKMHVRTRLSSVAFVRDQLVVARNDGSVTHYPFKENQFEARGTPLQVGNGEPVDGRSDPLLLTLGASKDKLIAWNKQTKIMSRYQLQANNSVAQTGDVKVDNPDQMFGDTNYDVNLVGVPNSPDLFITWKNFCTFFSIWNINSLVPMPIDLKGQVPDSIKFLCARSLEEILISSGGVSDLMQSYGVENILLREVSAATCSFFARGINQLIAEYAEPDKMLTMAK